MRKLFVAVLSMFLVTAWAQPVLAQSDTPPPPELEAVLADWQTAFNAGDGAAVMAIYHADAVRMPPIGEFLRGDGIAAEVANYAGWQIELGMYGGMIEGDMATSWGRFELNGMDESGNAISTAGRWMNNYRKVDGAWKIYRDIWNFGPDGQPDWMQ